MKRFRARPFPLVVIAAVAAVCLLGCEEDDDDDKDIGPNVGGKWSGTYYITDGSENEEITATVKHNGDSVTIKTSREGMGASFSGTIDAEGNMRLTDASDGETWTTDYGPASKNELKIADILLERSLSDPPMAVIDLTR